MSSLEDRDARDRIVVTCFWNGALEAVREVDPSIKIGLLVADWADPAWALDLAGELGCTALCPHQSLVTVELVEAAHSADLAVMAWTINGPEAVASVVAVGVDTVITDDVASAKTVLDGGGSPG